MTLQGFGLAAFLVVVALTVGTLFVVLQMQRAALADARRQAGRQAADLGETSASAESEALRFGRMLAAMPDGVLLFVGDRVAYANAAATALLGGDPVRLTPRINSSGSDSFIVQVHHPRYREVECLRTRLDAATTLLVARDVTEAHRVDRMRRDFVANASHEMKTPVSAIHATAETLVSAIEDDPESAKRFISILVREASGLSRLVQDLLDLARLDDPTPANEHADLSAVARASAAEFGRRAQETSVEVRSDITPGLQVRAREGDLRVCLTNLLENALRYTSAGGVVRLRVASDSDMAIIEVADTGEGIPARDLPRVFERFYRVDRARARETGGTGLGLSIVKHIAEQSAGSVHAHSIYGEGSTFTVRLPLHDRGTS